MVFKPCSLEQDPAVQSRVGLRGCGIPKNNLKKNMIYFIPQISPKYPILALKYPIAILNTLKYYILKNPGRPWQSLDKHYPLNNFLSRGSNLFRWCEFVARDLSTGYPLQWWRYRKGGQGVVTPPKNMLGGWCVPTSPQKSSWNPYVFFPWDVITLSWVFQQKLPPKMQEIVFQRV